MAWLVQFLGGHFAARLPQRLVLRFAAAFRHRLGKVGEQHREPEPSADSENEARRLWPAYPQGLKAQPRGQHTADKHREHHWVADLAPGIELLQGFEERSP